MKIFLFFFVIFSQYCFAQSQKTFKPCSKTINYTVDDWMLRKKVGMDLTIPLSNPRYVGGVEELTKYFAANPINDSDYGFRTFIGFVVNCKGEVGNFQIVSEGRGDLREQVLEKVKKMPQKWKPAISKEGKPVDSYQIIILTLAKGKFTYVEYR